MQKCEKLKRKKNGDQLLAELISRPARLDVTWQQQQQLRFHFLFFFRISFHSKIGRNVFIFFALLFHFFFLLLWIFRLPWNRCYMYISFTLTIRTSPCDAYFPQLFFIFILNFLTRKKENSSLLIDDTNKNMKNVNVNVFPVEKRRDIASVAS